MPRTAATGGAARSMVQEMQRQASTEATAQHPSSYSPVPLPSEQRTDIQQRYMEMLSTDELMECKVDESLGWVGMISEDDIRKSLLVEAKRRKYWNSRTIEKMQFEEILQGCCYHYILESFTESRSIVEAIESSSSSSMVRSRTNEHNCGPSTRTEADGTTADYSTANPILPRMHSIFSADIEQNPWDFDIQPDDDFINQIKILEMPNSHRTSNCQSCNGKALVHCFHCKGMGTDKCSYCRGTGMKAGIAHPALYSHPMIGTFPGHDPVPVAGRGHPLGSVAGSATIRPALLGAQRDKPYAAGTPVHFMAKAGLPPPGIGQHDLCIFCHARGIRDCQHCKGQGKKQCIMCGGNGQVRVFTKLKVLFGVERTDYYTTSEVPELLLRQASGDLIFSETRPYVQPIRKHPIKEINEVSKSFCAAHLKKMLDSCRVLKQRHCIERIEMAKVRFRLGSKVGCFYIFGNQRLCHIPEGPSRCSVM